MTKVFAVILGLFVSMTFAFAESKQTFMPENDLWKEDSLLYSAGKVSQELFNDIIRAGVDVYTPVAVQKGEKLVINARWTDATVNANCCRGCKRNEVTVNMYGGLARREEIIPEGFALVLCHELGHAYAGRPYIADLQQMSAEGQSDFYSTSRCYNEIAKKVPELQQEMEHPKYVKETCEAKFEKNSKDCMHALEGGLSLGNLLAALTKEPAPQFETPDPTVVTRTQLSYPATVQCRLDSYHNGALDMVRPACWFKEDSIVDGWQW